MGEGLISERRGRALWLILDRPDVHNALNFAMTTALVEALDAASEDEALRAVVLTGTGSKSFCSGADLRESQGGMFRSADGRNPIGNVLRAIEACSKPVIARINGIALAGGIGLVAASDLAYAADHATFGLPEVRVGLFPFMVGAIAMPQMPRRRLQEMAYLGERISAEEALHFGLINGVSPAGELDGLISKVLGKLALASPAAISAGKKAFAAMGSMPKAESISMAEDMLQQLASGPEANEGRAAFAEKRKPRWTEE